MLTLFSIISPAPSKIPIPNQVLRKYLLKLIAEFQIGETLPHYH